MAVSDSGQAGATIGITPAMVDAGVQALLREADELGMQDVPCPQMLVEQILVYSLRQLP